MKKVLVLYQSKYGATKKYVDMLKKEIVCDVFETNSFQFNNASNYDIIVFAGGIYANGISGVKYIKKNIEYIKNKKICVFMVGASPCDKKAVELVKEHNLKNIPFEITVFYGRGIYDENIMSFKDRTLCKMLKKSLQKKDPTTFEPWMKAIFEASGKSCDWTDRNYVNPLIEYIEQNI